ncbi:hypothetical protein RJ640_011336 [Escallonia rubra]|uniref:Protein kinase domain-containing protein n=1 Tax=Escallonia rubra TaxID=112253 RepID=A0AA88UJQ8_9ASTE|nr:hypothetical protein RJ640_011336 [Escallonia rubra]
MLIGSGGFGFVYKAVLDDGTTASVKRRNMSSQQGLSEFVSEIEILSLLQHRNIISLIGYCINGGEMILVYEYMTNGNLAQHLHGEYGPIYSPLSWIQRLYICVNVARGMDYVHCGASLHSIIHRDVKTSNILIGPPNQAYYVPDVLGSPPSFDPGISTTVKGTLGYLDPDYFLTKKVTSRSDVYSFGVVLLEVLCGRKPVDMCVDEDQRILAKWALYCIVHGCEERIIDSNLGSGILPDCLKVFVGIARQCLHTRPQKRPTMAEVVVRLEFALTLQRMEGCNMVERALAFSGGAVDGQEDSDLEDHVIRTDGFNDRDSNPSTRFSFSGSNGSLTVTEPVVTVKANSSMDTSAVILGYHDEEIHGLEIGGTPTDQEVVNAGTYDTDGAYDNQQNVISHAEENVTHVGVGGHEDEQISRINDNDEDYNNQQNAISSSDEDVIDVAVGGHHNEQTDEACNTRGADDNKGKTKFSPEEVNLSVVNVGCSDGQINSNILLGEASVGHKFVEPGSMRFRRKLHVSLLGAKPSNNSRGTDIRGQIVTPNLKIFTFPELSRATNNFRPEMVLGTGGLGMVFKGWLDEKTYAPSAVGVGMAVVVKKLDTNGSLGPKEAQVKVKTLGKFSHPNLVKLIEDSEPLSWVTRFRVALGAAQGLSFLHKTREQAMYRTFKASDILLDENFSAKLSDFGLFKLGPMNSESVISTLVAGDTAFMDFPQKDVGYVDPEYMASGNLTMKSDIYGFGAVLLEILTGQRVLDLKRPSGKHDFVRYARPFLNGKRDIKTILDNRLEHECTLEDKTLSAVCALTLKCLEDYSKKRPSVKEVLETLERATNKFDGSKLLGRGGYGSVYKAVLDDGTTVAMKRRSLSSRQGADEFRSEIELLSRLQHRNIVSLIGYCIDRGEMILVYEYMAKDNLAQNLHGNYGFPLGWIQRLHICINVARGLDYVHSGASLHSIIHRDVKTSNILLDENFVAKITDFGLSRIGRANQAYYVPDVLGSPSSVDTHISTTVVGTLGYLDPDYFLTNKVTSKSDVYAFGMVLLEVLCGRKAVDMSVDEEERNLARWAMYCIEHGSVERIIDPHLDSRILPDCLKVFVGIARQCLHTRAQKRPTMAEVVVRLEFALTLQRTEGYNIVERALAFSGAAVDGQEDSDLEDHATRTDFNDRDSNPSIRFSFSGSSGSLTVTEPEVTVNANSSMDTNAGILGYHDEEIHGLEIGGTPTEQEVVNASSYDTDGAYDNQQNVISPAEENVTHVGVGGHEDEQISRINDNDEDYDNQQNATSSAEEDVIDVAVGGHHNEQIDEANIGGADDNKGRTKFSPEEVNLSVVNVECPDGKINSNILLGEASVGHIFEEPGSMRFRRKVQLFFRDPARVISGAKPPKNIRGTNLRGQIVTPNLKIFTFAELSRATNNFGSDMVLGRGSLGMVFKGWVDEKTYAPSVVGVGMAVVVKKVDTNGSLGPKEAQLKVKILGKFSHPNLVKLIGYCVEDEDVLLVCEYMKKGSLESHLFKKDSEPLPWVTRLKIALGAAQGLAFLHNTREQAMYRTFKASDILLDENFSAKLSDFGLFKLGPMSSESVISTLVAGDTAFMDFPQKDVGYVDPEYMASGNLTVKSDIYGFGAVLLEILTGQRVLDMKRPSGKHDLVRYARPYLNGKRDIKIILDRRLEHEYAPEDEILSAVAALTLKCLEDYPKNRPGVKEVLETLEQVNAFHMEANGASSSSSRHPSIESQE